LLPGSFTGVAAVVLDISEGIKNRPWWITASYHHEIGCQAVHGEGKTQGIGQLIKIDSKCNVAKNNIQRESQEQQSGEKHRPEAKTPGNSRSFSH